MGGHMANRASQLIKKQIEVQKGPKWKRELVPDHKFDFIDVSEFYDRTCYKSIKYVFLYISIVISTLVYLADLWTAGILLIFDRWSLSTPPKIPFEISKWIYVGCIILSFLFLAWDVYKAKQVYKTRDISLAVTNTMVYRRYSVKGFAYYCLFQRIEQSKKTSDMFAFFVFYTLKGWKRLLFAQGPRQIIAGVTVYALLRSAWTKNGHFEVATDWDIYGENWQQRLALILMSFTCLLWILSMIELIAACILYIPVFCRIQGNLKEYICHKIDKRIGELLERQRQKRIRQHEMKHGQQKRHKQTRKEKEADMLAAAIEPSMDDYDQYADDTPLRKAASPLATSGYRQRNESQLDHSEYARRVAPFTEAPMSTASYSPSMASRAHGQALTPEIHPMKVYPASSHMHQQPHTYSPGITQQSTYYNDSYTNFADVYGQFPANEYQQPSHPDVYHHSSASSPHIYQATPAAGSARPHYY